MNAKDMREFRSYLRQCANAQVCGVCEKEPQAGRDEFAELGLPEAEQQVSCSPRRRPL